MAAFRAAERGTGGGAAAAPTQQRTARGGERADRRPRVLAARAGDGNGIALAMALLLVALLALCLGPAVRDHVA
ncbi:hypothetical protein [Blastococcus montanus]|uniref:hypothetical protein n=1 Tax=Blastococcus montanus TaxID=3144973 RepID=UPI00320989B8